MRIVTRLCAKPTIEMCEESLVVGTESLKWFIRNQRIRFTIGQWIIGWLSGNGEANAKIMPLSSSKKKECISPDTSIESSV